MIEQVLQQIKATEETANKIRTDAEENKQARIKEGELEAARIMSDAQKQLAEDKRKYKAQTQEECDALYQSALAEAKKDAEEVYQKASVKTQAIAQDIVKGILNGNCWNVAHEAFRH